MLHDLKKWKFNIIYQAIKLYQTLFCEFLAYIILLQFSYIKPPEFQNGFFLKSTTKNKSLKLVKTEKETFDVCGLVSIWLWLLYFYNKLRKTISFKIWSRELKFVCSVKRLLVLLKINCWCVWCLSYTNGCQNKRWFVFTL